MSELILATDISGWQERPPRIWFEQMYDAGYRMLIAQLVGGTPQGFGANRDAPYQLAMARLVGMDTGGYGVIPEDNEIETGALVQLILDAAGDELQHLRTIALDIEPNSSRLHPADPMGRLVNAYLNLTAQVPQRLGRHLEAYGIYSNPHYWGIAFGSRDVAFPYAHEAYCWEARYVFPSGQGPSQAPNIDWNWQPWGGWQQRAALQYAGTVPTFGVGADWNTVDLDRMGLTKTKEEVMANKFLIVQEGTAIPGYGDGWWYVLDPSGRIAHIINPAHLDSLWAAGFMDNALVKVMPAHQIAAIPRVADDIDPADVNGVTIEMVREEIGDELAERLQQLVLRAG